MGSSEGCWPGLAGRVAVVTGASRGLGAHFARLLAAHGARVAAAARSADGLEDVVAAIRQAGGEALAVPMDVCEPGSIATALATIEDRLGPVDLLVNNAGVTVQRPVLEQTGEDWDYVVDTNLKGPFLVSTAVARRMRELGRGGAIVNVASVLGIRQAGHVAPYATSKAGLIQLTRVMALEMARHGIRVNALAPGYFATDINRDFWETDAGRSLVGRIPQRRLGRLEELDGPLLLLASEASSFMTGEVIAVDGGHLVGSL